MRSSFDLSLYLVLDPVQCDGHDAAVAVARAALESGVTLVQLRAPEWHKRAWFDLARELLPITRAHRVPFVINDHVDVALAVGANGVHVDQRDLPADITRKMLGPDALIGLSVSNLAEAEAADRFDGIIDYVGAGPVWATPTKTDASALCGIDGIVAMRAQPVGIAVVSAICKASNPRDAAALAVTIVQSRS
ncbi:Thiamin-phosphate pyrophosphorylase [Candidatus Burkholderia brachyanthoides]|nr:Thiamin-phosphate pyrophosphorylase [Candidatus Burkholderia brachyanthoides]